MVISHDDLVMDEVQGLTMIQAMMVSFNSGLGASMAMVAYYPCLCGMLGFPLLLLLMAGTAILMQQTLMIASTQQGASTFEEICERLPKSLRQMSVCFVLLYLWGSGGFCCQFIASFLLDQLCPWMCESDGSFWMCQRELNTSLVVFVFAFVACYPPRLFGWMSLGLNYLNALTKITLLCVAFVKGISVWSTRTERTEIPSYTVWRPAGMLSVLSLLAGSLANSGIMPQLVADLHPSLLKKASVWCPIVAVSLQATTMAILTLVGYAAMGNNMQLNTFHSYDEKYPDILTSILQGGMALLSYLSMPLMIMPCKSQVWNFFQHVEVEGDRSLGSASVMSQMTLNLVFTLSAACLPGLLGFSTYGNLFVALTSTCGVWTSIILPALVLLYCEVLPSFRSGTLRKRQVLLVSWIFLVGIICFIDGIFQMLALKGTTGKSAHQRCIDAFLHHHGSSFGSLSDLQLSALAEVVAQNRMRWTSLLTHWIQHASE